MTKEEAIEMMLKGVKMTHEYFEYDEWVYIDSVNQYVADDGVVCSEREFWQFKQHKSWQTGWTIYQED